MENRKVKVKVTHLTKKFGDLLVLNDVSFDVYDGEFLCIVGPTGCGKTTLVNLIMGVDVPTSGTVRVLGEGAPSARREHASGLCPRTTRSTRT